MTELERKDLEIVILKKKTRDYLFGVITLSILCWGLTIGFIIVNTERMQLKRAALQLLEEREQNKEAIRRSKPRPQNQPLETDL